MAAEFTWRRADGGAVLAACAGAEGTVRVPETALGLPVTEIGPGAFLNRAGLTGVALPKGLRAIGANAFYGCTGLREIDIPDGVARVGASAFQGCARLRSVRLPEGLGEIAPRLCYICPALEEIDIPRGVARVGEHAFAGCARLRRAALPEGLEAIEAFAFADCPALEAMDIPASVTRLDASAVPMRLYRAGGLFLPGQGLLVRASASLAYAAPEGTRIIADSALAGNHDLTEVRLPGSVEAVGAQAFEDCRCLRRVNLPAAVVRIGPAAFRGCAALRAVELPPALRQISDGLFEGGGLEAVALPGRVEAVGARAFAGCAGLESVELNPGLQSLGEGAFARCARLRRLELPASLRSVGGGALAGCAGLRELYLPGGFVPGLESAVSDVRRMSIIAPNALPEAFPPLWRKRVCLGFALAEARRIPVRPDVAAACVEWLRRHSAALVADAAANDPLLRAMLDHRCFAARDARRLLDRISGQNRPEITVELLGYIHAAEESGGGEELWD